MAIPFAESQADAHAEPALAGGYCHREAALSNDYQTSNPWFGIRPPEGAKVAFGARALFTRHGIDIPHDRMQWRGAGNVAKANACLKELNRRVQKHPPSPIQNKEHSFVLRGWECRYNTRASMGYLYILILPKED